MWGMIPRTERHWEGISQTDCDSSQDGADDHGGFAGLTHRKGAGMEGSVTGIGGTDRDTAWGTGAVGWGSTGGDRGGGSVWASNSGIVLQAGVVIGVFHCYRMTRYFVALGILDRDDDLGAGFQSSLPGGRDIFDVTKIEERRVITGLGGLDDIYTVRPIVVAVPFDGDVFALCDCWSLYSELSSGSGDKESRGKECGQHFVKS